MKFESKQAIKSLSLAAFGCGLAFYGGYLQGKKSSLTLENWGDSITQSAVEEWWPKVGDQVSTLLQPDGSVGEARIVTITNLIHVGQHSQSGILVYGDGLPGVDLVWVKPAP